MGACVVKPGITPGPVWVSRRTSGSARRVPLFLQKPKLSNGEATAALCQQRTSVPQTEIASPSQSTRSSKHDVAKDVIAELQACVQQSVCRLFQVMGDAAEHIELPAIQRCLY